MKNVCNIIMCTQYIILKTIPKLDGSMINSQLFGELLQWSTIKTFTVHRFMHTRL